MHTTTLKKIIITLVFLAISLSVNSQSISGVVNSYTTVSAVSGASVTVGSSAGLLINDSVMIIQMTGISGGGNTGGTDNGAGNFHVALITSIAGTTITLNKPITKTFSPATEKVQLVKIAKYNNDVTVAGTVSAQPWNGSTGGIIFIDACDNDITLNANINASGDGFFGRNTTGNSSVNNCGASLALVNTPDENWGTDPIYFGGDFGNAAPLSGGTGRGGHGGCNSFQGSPDGGAGVGGDGANSTDNTLGSGGGGGSYGGGGTSGGSGFTISGTAAPAVGNVFNTSGDLRLFMGASGGSEAEWAPAVGNGGGIIIILCDNLNTDGSNRNIISDGDDGPNSGTFAFAGFASRVTGGAGGAGYIAINANTINPQARAFARGGDGTVQVSPPNPTFIEYGGPGGGGFVISSTAIANTSVRNGNILAGNGALDGADGLVVVDSGIDDNFISGCDADLRLTKTVNTSVLKVGGSIVYTLNLTNDGPLIATGVQVTDVLPAGLTFSSDNSAATSTTFAGNVWNVGNLNVNQTINLEITATVTGAGAIVNTAEVTQSGQTDTDSTPGNGN